MRERHRDMGFWHFVQSVKKKQRKKKMVLWDKIKGQITNGTVSKLIKTIGI